MKVCDVVDSPVDLGENPACGSPGGGTVPPWVAEPYRLWSLLEIMQVIDPDFFSHVLSFCNLGGVFDGIQTTLDKLQVKDKKITDRKTKFMSLEEAEVRAEHFSQFGLPRSGDILKEWAGQRAVSRHLPAEVVIPELRRSIERELRANLFLYIPEQKRRYIEDRNGGFGEAVLTCFPSTIYDLQEAGKCFALDRFTACVFHLMRVMEVGLRTLGASLSDPQLDPRTNPSWERILSRSEKELGKALRDRSPEWQTNELFFSTATANLRAVKDAWRNPTLHVERSYNEEEAHEVHNSVRSFMRHLSTFLRE